MTIAGSVYVASLFFWVMGWRRIGLNPESFAHSFEQYLTYLAVSAVGLSYIFGFVAHRIIQIVNLRLGRWKPIKYLAGRIEKIAIRDENDTGEQVRDGLKERMAREVDIWTLDPPRTHREIDFQFAQVALLRSLIWSVPFLAVSVFYWRLRTWHHVHVVWHDYRIALTACFGLFFLGSSLIRLLPPVLSVRNNSRFALRVARKRPDWWVPILTPISGPVGSLVTITGINFGLYAETSKVTGADMETWEPTRIKVRVPRNATVRQKLTIEVHAVVPHTDTGSGFTLQLTCPPFTVTD